MSPYSSLGILAAAVVLTLAGCALQARSDVDARASVGICHNYAFGEGEQRQPDSVPAFTNPLNEKRLREAIQGHLAAHNLPLVDVAAADCTVGYAIGSRLAIDDYYGYGGWGWGMGWGWGYPGAYGALAWDSGPHSYREDRVSVNLFNARTHDALWHASVDVDITHLTGASAEKRINEAVTVMFAKFPGGTAAAPSTP